MNKFEELANFTAKADDLIKSKYIVADIKIANLLKTIASSDTILAVFKNCLDGFDFNEAKRRYLVKNEFLAEDKGEFVSPTSPRELLSFVFCVLVSMDNKEIQISDFIKTYFYEDGSYYSGYEAFVNAMIKPFVDTLTQIMKNVIDGKIQDPVEALTEAEERKNEELRQRDLELKKEQEISQKTYGESLKEIKKILLEDKTKVKSKVKQEKSKDLILVIDTFANALESDDKDAINYSYVAYRYVVKAHKILFFGRNRKIAKLIGDVLNGL